MLDTAPVHPTIAVKDINRAREFYGPTLGLKEEKGTQDETFYNAGNGTSLLVYKSPDNAGTSKATVCSFEVKDIEKTVKELTSKGVKFEDYDMPGIKTVNHIATSEMWKGAWFKDPDGNILAVGQMMNK